MPKKKIKQSVDTSRASNTTPDLRESESRPNPYSDSVMDKHFEDFCKEMQEYIKEMEERFKERLYKKANESPDGDNNLSHKV